MAGLFFACFLGLNVRLSTFSIIMSFSTAKDTPQVSRGPRFRLSRGLFPSRTPLTQWFLRVLTERVCLLRKLCADSPSQAARNSTRSLRSAFYHLPEMKCPPSSLPPALPLLLPSKNPFDHGRRWVPSPRTPNVSD